MKTFREYLNGAPHDRPYIQGCRPGEYLGLVWIENAGDEDLVDLVIYTKYEAEAAPVILSNVRGGDGGYEVRLGTIRPGGRGVFHARTLPGAYEGPISLGVREGR